MSLVRFDPSPVTVKKSFMYCLKNEQECIIRFKNSRIRLEFLNLIIHDSEFFLNGFKFSDIDQLILALIFQIWGYYLGVAQTE